MTNPTGNILHFNGIDPENGDYVFPKRTVSDFAAMLRGRYEDRSDHFLVRLFLELLTKKKLITIEGVDPDKIEEAGWGVIFAKDAPPAVYEALQPLLKRRKEQAGEYYREFRGKTGYVAPKTSIQFITENGSAPGPVDPKKMPYYLLIVGSPAEIPFEFQFNLDIQHAVGRIHFNRIEDYAQYANNVVAAETLLQPAGNGKPHAAFFGPTHPDEPYADQSAEFLIQGLARELAGKFGQDGTFKTIHGPAAIKSELGSLMGGSTRPDLLFTATHGLPFTPGHSRQLKHQGALVCADWPGPEEWGRQSLNQDQFFAGEDLAANADLRGMIGFHFSCFSGGTPHISHFPEKPNGRGAKVAEQPFVARLPMSMLAHPKGCLAAVGHVDGAYLWTFTWEPHQAQTQLFADCFSRLLKGQHLGRALEVFHISYAERRAQYEELREIEKAFPQMKRNDDLLTRLWLSINDARNYILLGDPAVSLPNAARHLDVTH